MAANETPDRPSLTFRDGAFPIVPKYMYSTSGKHRSINFDPVPEEPEQLLRAIERKPAASRTLAEFSSILTEHGVALRTYKSKRGGASLVLARFRVRLVVDPQQGGTLPNMGQIAEAMFRLFGGPDGIQRFLRTEAEIRVLGETLKKMPWSNPVALDTRLAQPAPFDDQQLSPVRRRMEIVGADEDEGGVAEMSEEQPEESEEPETLSTAGEQLAHRMRVSVLCAATYATLANEAVDLTGNGGLRPIVADDSTAQDTLSAIVDVTAPRTPIESLLPTFFMRAHNYSLTSVSRARVRS